MKKIILLLAMLVSFIASAYEPMIREDRIWEFVKGTEDEINHVRGIIKYRFSGTETKNGIKYNVLNIMWEDGSLEPIALMRENVKTKEIYVYCEQDEITFYGANKFIHFNLSANKEILLYSTPSREDGFDIMPYGGLVISFNDIYYGYYQLELFSLVHHETLNYLDTPRGFYCHRPYKREGSSFSNADGEVNQYVNEGYYYVEGVGNVGFGAPYLPARAAFLICQSSDDLPYRFLRLTDPWGNTVFDARWIFGGSDIESVNAESRPADERKYNLQGVETDRPKPGSIYIQNGEKHVAN